MPARTDREVGTVVVEFALVLPLLFLFLLAAVQIGLLARDQLLLTQAARAGAREAAVTLDEAAVRDVTIEAAPGLDPDRLQMRLERSGSIGTAVTVVLGYASPVTVPVAGWLLPHTVVLRASATMRQEVA